MNTPNPINQRPLYAGKRGCLEAGMLLSAYSFLVTLEPLHPPRTLEPSLKPT